MKDDKATKVLQHVAALSNPALPRMTMGRQKQLFKGLRIVSSEEQQDYGATLFTYKADPAQFDTGFIIHVGYHRNLDQDECIENNIIENPGEYILPPVFLYDHFISRVELTHHFIRLVFKTVDGQPTFVHVDAFSEVPYPSLPAHIGLPVIPITSLCRTVRQPCHHHIDIVLLGGETFAFKHYGLNPFVTLREPGDQRVSVLKRGDDRLLHELKHLCQFDSPSIARPKFVVSSGSGAFRGFLTPFYPAGDLEAIFSDLHPQENPSNDQWDPEPLSLRSQSDPASAPGHASHDGLPKMKQITWGVKELWALDIVRGVAALHAASSFSGDLKLQNIVLGQDGHLRLIDVAPQSGWTEEYMPPEGVVMFKTPKRRIELTAERDIFAVGLILWALSEEVAQFERLDIGAAPLLVWRDGVDAAPNWYRELAWQCVLGNPDRRPSAQAVLETLLRNSNSSNPFHI